MLLGEHFNFIMADACWGDQLASIRGSLGMKPETARTEKCSDVTRNRSAGLPARYMYLRYSRKI